MMPRMADEKPQLRLTESLPGRLAGVLLALLWVFSMGGVDAHAFSSFPACVVLAGVLLLVAVGLVLGRRVVRMSWLGWCALLAGGYFLLRCLHSYAVVDSWCESVLILGGFVYYVAGVYAAQSRSYASLFWLLAGVLVLQVAAFWVVRQPWFCLEWTGRAPQTMAGANSRPVTLFVYKNFAGVFQCLSGVVLGMWAVWGQQGGRRLCMLLVAGCSVGLSFFCGTRAVYVILPLLLVCGWLLYVVWQVCAGKKLGGVHFLLGFLLVLGVGVAVYDLVFGGELLSRLLGADSHLRYLIWASVCEVLPAVPATGCGANVTQWEIVPFYSEWQLPNYAHNEYLQAWVDYGPVGVLLVVLVVVLHLLRGLFCLAAEPVGQARKVLVMACMLLLVGLAAYAVVDFPWHSFALVGLTAFAAGVLASPFPHVQAALPGRRKWLAGKAPLVRVVVQKWPGRVVLLLLVLGLAAVSAGVGQRLWPAWQAQWAYNELCAPGADPRGDSRRSFIARLMPHYPSPALADTYFMLPPYNPDLAEREQLLKTALSANPKQLFTLTMLVDVLGARHKFAEAELLMRRHYVGESMPASLLNNWPAYYAYNLLIWGRSEMQQGNHARALSLMDYALRMNRLSRIAFNPVWRSGPQPWRKHGGIKPELPQLLRTAERDVQMLRLIGTAPDDSWQRPLEQGGRPALYRTLLSKAG